MVAYVETGTVPNRLDLGFWSHHTMDRLHALIPKLLNVWRSIFVLDVAGLWWQWIEKIKPVDLIVSMNTLWGVGSRGLGSRV